MITCESVLLKQGLQFYPFLLVLNFPSDTDLYEFDGADLFMLFRGFTLYSVLKFQYNIKYPTIIVIK